MRVVLQRVSEGRVTIQGKVAGRIGKGLVLLVGFTEGDDGEVLRWMADKILGLRIFSDRENKMNLSLEDVGGELLVVSQFTLYGDTRKGRRPSFVKAAHPDQAIPLYEEFLGMLRERAPGSVASGEFGAMMDVALVNEGPVTLVLER
jgi:D-tyrosyl-tRNA(Tyr) deacylase